MASRVIKILIGDFMSTDELKAKAAPKHNELILALDELKEINQKGFNRLIEQKDNQSVNDLSFRNEWAKKDKWKARVLTIALCLSVTSFSLNVIKVNHNSPVVISIKELLTLVGSLL